MLSIGGDSYRLCDGLQRRSFLKIGGLALGGFALNELTLPQILEAQSTQRSTADSSLSHKSVIMVYLAGGPSQLETIDLKPEAPREIRGPCQPIESNVSGMGVCELLPRLSGMMDKFAVIRSVWGGPDQHVPFHCYTGRWQLRPQPTGGWPTFGSVSSKLQGPVHPSVPAYVDASPAAIGSPQYRNIYPSFLGVGHQPFRPEEESKHDMTLNNVGFDRLEARKGLLSEFDGFRRRAEVSGAMEGVDAFRQQAYGLLTSGKLAEAFDLQREDQRTLDRCGKGGPTHPNYQAPPKSGYHLLLARRLVEAGVRCVTVSCGAWDWHANGNAGGPVAKHVHNDLPMFDQAFSGLVEDIYSRGLDQDVTVIGWGEFGRTPRLNKNGGRDHWPGVGCAFVAGGGLRTGQIIGASDRHAAYPADRPVHFQEMLATIYHQLGIDVSTATVSDLQGRPHYLVDEGRQPIAELL